MSRGVSYATGSVWKCYMQFGLGEEYADEWEMRQAWDDFKENLLYMFNKKFPSLTECSKWLGREDLTFAENNHAYLGLSEYNGIVCLWCVPKQGDYGYAEDNLHQNWCEQVEANARKLLLKSYPENMLCNMGHASNGEQFFTPVNRPEGVVTSKEGVLF